MLPTRVIVNADDFGQSPGVNRGIVRAHREGIVTSASVMVRWPAAAQAVELSRECPALDVGLHLDFGEWSYVDGDWVAKYQTVELTDQVAVAAETQRQLDMFQRLTGCQPSHLDSHQHVHLRSAVRAVIEDAACRLDVPLRHGPAIRYCGEFYGQDADGTPAHGRITVSGLMGILRGLTPGITELCCHPADSEDLDTMYLAERQLELATLCDPRVRRAIGSCGIQLCSFRDVRVRPSSH